MRLNTLSPAKKSKKSRKRICRGIGCGFGKTGGRGHKGQKSRSGSGIPRGFEGGQMPICRRLPKFGFISKKSKIITEVRLSELNKIKDEVINIQSLKNAKIISMKTKFAKIILTGKIFIPVIIRELLVTKGARSMIEAAGGKIEV